jgi:hypothetical protein
MATIKHHYTVRQSSFVGCHWAKTYGTELGIVTFPFFIPSSPFHSSFLLDSLEIKEDAFQAIAAVPSTRRF